MDWEVDWGVVLAPIAALVIFIAGQIWNTFEGDRRERRASRAAPLAAFEQLQRETHLELQDALAATFEAADRELHGGVNDRAFATAHNRANA